MERDVKENQRRIDVQVVKADIIYKHYSSWEKETLVLNWVPFWIQHEQVGMDSEGAGWECWMENYWQESSETWRDYGYSNLIGFLLKACLGDQIPRMGVVEVDHISRVDIFTKLT